MKRKRANVYNFYSLRIHYPYVSAAREILLLSQSKQDSRLNLNTTVRRSHIVATTYEEIYFIHCNNHVNQFTVYGRYEVAKVTVPI